MSNVSVIIVNYNTAELTIQAVESVLALSEPTVDLDIHIVENASSEGDANILQKHAQTPAWAEHVTLYCEQTNHGFGRGNNVALHALTRRDHPPEFVFFLNPDAQLRNNAIGILKDFMAANPKAALLGTRSYKPGQDAPVSAAFRFPSLLSIFSSSLSFGPVSRILARHKTVFDGKIETQRVDWVSGAAVLARFDVLRDIGFFDPEYFLYFEEVDMMRAVVKSGWECWHVCEAEIIHIEGATTGVKSSPAQKPRRPAYWYHSWFYYFLKNHGRGYALSCACAWVLGAALNRGIAQLRGKAPSTPKGFFSDFWAVAIRPLLGLDARPY